VSTAAMTMIKNTITKVCGTLRFFIRQKFVGKDIEIIPNFAPNLKIKEK